MRKLLLSIAAAGSLVAVASPASAQWHRPGYGYNGDQREGLERAVQQIRIQRDELARSGRLDPREARDLDNDIRRLQYSVESARGPLSPWQVRNLQNRVYEVRAEIRRYSDFDRSGRHGYGRRY